MKIHGILKQKWLVIGIVVVHIVLCGTLFVFAPRLWELFLAMHGMGG